jgi:hypothetical protein
MITSNNGHPARPIETLGVRNLNDGRYAVMFRQRGKDNRYKHYMNIVTVRGMGAILAELDLAEREALIK